MIFLSFLYHFQIAIINSTCFVRFSIFKHNFSFDTGGYKMPSAHTFFNSMHSTDKTPARVANGSWNTKYRAYPFSCKFFDENLHGQFKGDLYIASAGNEGLDESTMESKERTIGNPASCKNTLAGKFEVVILFDSHSYQILHLCTHRQCFILFSYLLQLVQAKVMAIDLLLVTKGWITLLPFPVVVQLLMVSCF